VGPRAWGAKAGDVLVYRVAAYDTHPTLREASSASWRIRVESAEKKQTDMQAELSDLVAALRNLLRAQRLALERTGRIKETVSSGARFNEGRARDEMRKLGQTQAKVRADSAGLAERVKGASAFESRVREVLTGLCTNEFPAAESSLDAAAQEREPGRWPKYLDSAAKAQSSAAEAIKKLLEQAAAVLDRVKELPIEQALQAPEEALDRRALLQRAEHALKEFIENRRPSSNRQRNWPGSPWRTSRPRTMPRLKNSRRSRTNWRSS